jgi:hypothetical protein
MNSPTPLDPNQPVLAPAPWYTSEVTVRLVAAGAAQVVSVLFRLVDLFGYTLKIAAADVDAIGANLTQLITLVALGLALLKRTNSPVQPLTMTKRQAEDMTQMNPPLLARDPTKVPKA